MADNSFSFDQPWNPISYFDEETEDKTDQDRYSPNHLASLFEMNVSAIDGDIEKSRNLQILSHKSLEDQFDQNNIEDFTLETENGLKVLDATSTLNKKAIFSDFDRLRRLQETSEKIDDENNKSLFLSKSPDSLFQSEESKEKTGAPCPHGINLLLDPFASIVDEDDKFEDSNLCGEDRLKQLEERMNESGFVLQSSIFDIHLSDHKTSEPNCDIDNKTPAESNESNSLEVIEDNVSSLLDDLLDLPNVPTEIPKSNPKNNSFSSEFSIYQLKDDDKAETVNDFINSPDTQETDQLLEFASSITCDVIDKSVSENVHLNCEEAKTEGSKQPVDFSLPTYNDHSTDGEDIEACMANPTAFINESSQIQQDKIKSSDHDVSKYSSISENQIKEKVNDIKEKKKLTRDVENNEIVTKTDYLVNKNVNGNNYNGENTVNVTLKMIGQTSEAENEFGENILSSEVSDKNIVSDVPVVSFENDVSDENIVAPIETIDSVKDFASVQNNVSLKEVSEEPNSCCKNKNETKIEEVTNSGSLIEIKQEETATTENLTSRDEPFSPNESLPVGFEEVNVEYSPEDMDELIDNLERDSSLSEEASNLSLNKSDNEKSSQNCNKDTKIHTLNETTLQNTGEETSSHVDNKSEDVEDVEDGRKNTEEIVVVEPATTSTVEEGTNENGNQLDNLVSLNDNVHVNAVDGNSCDVSITETNELRTSLRRNGGGSSASGRRVHFSLQPEYQSAEDNSNETQPDLNNTGSSPTGSEGQVEGAAAVSGDTIPKEIQYLGWVAPEWVPDEKASHCMECNVKFTVVKRRHHCRACGKVLCSLCCNMKYCLPYLNYKFVRVCQNCCDVMISQALSDTPSTQRPAPTTSNQPLISEGESDPNMSEPAAPPPHTPLPPSSYLPQAPPPYSESVDGSNERTASASSDVPPYSEISPQARQFSEQPAPVLPAAIQGIDILPSNGRTSTLTGAQLTEMMNFQLPAYTPTARQRQNRNRTESEMSAVIMFNSTATNLPPIIRRVNEETRIVNNPDLDILFNQIHDEHEEPTTFIVNKNLVVRVKVVNLDCCVEKKCWCFTSDGMGASNQEEVVILVKCGSYDIEDRTLTRRVLQQMNHIFEKAKHGHPVSDLEQIEFDASMCCMSKNIGMLFFKHSLQCIKKLIIPTSPYLFGMYIERSEVAWSRSFPLRLLLRVGAEYKYYPCPLLNILDRPAVYDGVGRTILDLLADFRNFQYTVPRVVGVTINLRGKDTIIRLPQHRYDEVMKAVNSCEENVLSLAGNFSTTCDGHLVAVEKEGRYKTQTLSIVLKANRKVTCASFVVVSAALKTSEDGIKAKASIVEDGVMVQVTAEVMKEFKQAIKDMKEFSIATSQQAAGGSEEFNSKIGIEWSTADVMDRPRLLSPIDGTPFDNLTNMKIRHSYDYTSNNLVAKIHWIEVYFLPQDNDTVQRLSARELGQMTSSVAKACMSALSSHLMTLLALDMTRIGLRVNLAADFVEYKIGANLATLPAELLPGLDDKLVPAIHTVMSSAQERVAVELIFQVVKIV